MKVLVIEDEDSLRGTIVRSLEKERFIAEWAADYRTAMEKLNDYDYRLCVVGYYATGWKRSGFVGRVEKNA